MQYQRSIITVLGVAAVVIVGWYLYKHSQLGNPKDKSNKAAKDGKDGGKPTAWNG